MYDPYWRDKTMLGNVIRTRRKKMNLTLEELSKQVGITSGGLSQIERGLVDPSLSVLRRISRALNLPMNVMFSENNESYVTRMGQRKKAMFSDSSIDYEFLSPIVHTSGITPKVEVVMVTLRPQSYGGESLSAHESDECFVVVQGQIEVQMENETVLLQQADSLYLTEGVQHRLHNPTDTDAIGLSIMSGMTF